jgi:PAS domain-containing protein
VQNLLSSSLLSKNIKIRIYKTIILPVVLYGCETWALTLREEHRLRVFENRVLRRIFGLKRDEVKGEWRKLLNEELHDLYSSPSIIRIIKSRRMRWAGHVARMVEKRNVHRLLVEKPEGKRPLRRPRCRWVDIRMDHGEVDWIGVAKDRNRWRALVNSVFHKMLGNYRVASRVVLSSVQLS